ncbi:uncharacterized protein [Drosophila kikkawai]|uniref:PHD-type domain-containing protein n=1 Tax=Drosophila kikkawai TaxID=30033 RepID=A0ABM4GFV5_DROKI
MATCCFSNAQKISSRHVTVYCWLCDNIAHIGCADLGQNGSRITDRIRENPGLDWTCPSCLHIKSDMRVFMRQTHLEFQSLAVGFKELSTRFQKAEHHFKSLKLLNPECPLMQFTPRAKPAAVDNGSGDDAASITTSMVEDLVRPLDQQPVNVVQASTLHAAASAEVVAPVPILGRGEATMLPVQQPVYTDQASTSRAAAINDASVVSNANPVAPPVHVAKRGPVPLAGVAPKKQIFVSRLNPGASEGYVKTHLSSKLNVSVTEFSVSKNMVQLLYV